jgi:putative nucleotidyltransferase with HDIG domain
MTSSDQQKIQQMFDFSLEIAQVQDVDVLLEKILSAARKLVNADAGTIYIKTDQTLTFSHTQNDTLQKRLPPGKKLIYKTFVMPINHLSIAGYVASTGETVNIPDAYQLDALRVPYLFDRSYDEKAQYRTQSMLTIPLKNTRGEIVGVMQLINAQNAQGEIVPFLQDDIPLIRIFGNNATMAIERTLGTRTRILGMIHLLTELHDPEETEAHVNRVGAFAAEIYETWARKRGIPQFTIETNVEMLRMAAMLHDIGKLALPPNIRKKSGKFTAADHELMKQHTVKGAQMLLKSARTKYEEIAAEIALNHHESWNGTGYPGYINLETGQPLPGYKNPQGKPRGKVGEEIPIFGRVVALADVYDALSSRRIYRRALTEIEILKKLEKESGRHFDPEVIAAFFACLDTIRAIAQCFPDAVGW